MYSVLLFETKKGFSFFLTENKKVRVSNNIDEAKALLNESQYGLVIIDIEYDYKLGFILASFLRKMKNYFFIPLIFIAGNNEHKEECYKKFHPYEFLIKPLDVNVINSFLNLYETSYVFEKNTIYNAYENREYLFSFSEDGTYKRVSFFSILYIKSEGKRVRLITLKNEHVISGYRLSDFPILSKGILIQCHRSIVVNPAFIQSYDYINGVISIGLIDVELKVGRKYVKNVRNSLPY